MSLRLLEINGISYSKSITVFLNNQIFNRPWILLRALSTLEERVPARRTLALFESLCADVPSTPLCSLLSPPILVFFYVPNGCFSFDDALVSLVEGFDH